MTQPEYDKWRLVNMPVTTTGAVQTSVTEQATAGHTSVRLSYHAVVKSLYLYLALTQNLLYQCTT